MSNASFGKEEKLCSKKEIDSLFKDGNSFVEYPLKVIYNELDSSIANTRVLISVPKRRFRKAVDRNRIKRLIREGYRKSKMEFLENLNADGKYFALAFVYIGKDIPHYSGVAAAMQLALDKMKTQNQ
jgi:ribonuclease P protein component